MKPMDEEGIACQGCTDNRSFRNETNDEEGIRWQERTENKFSNEKMMKSQSHTINGESIGSFC